MPLPDSPQTREEMYLNGIATGSTDGLPDAPVTREEMYLDYIARNGGGGGGGGGSSALSGLTDVDISNPKDGQVLVYDATSQKWVNDSAGGGGGALVVRGVTVGEEVTLDHTYAEIVSAAPLVYYALEPAPNRASFKPLNAFGAVDELYVVQFGNETPFSTDSEDGYPVSRGIN